MREVWCPWDEVWISLGWGDNFDHWCLAMDEHEEGITP